MKREFRKLTELIKTANQEEVSRAEFPAVLGNTSGTVLTGTSGLVYVTKWNGEVITVINRRVPNKAYSQIVVGYDPAQPNTLQVLRGRDVFGRTDRAPQVADHAETHWLDGGDTDFVEGKRLLPLLIAPSSGFEVQLYGAVLEVSGDTGPVIVQNQIVDMVAHVQTADAVWVLMEANESGTIVLTEGAGVDSKELLTVTDIPDVTFAPLWAVRFYPGQESLAVDDFLDLRNMLVYPPAGAVSIVDAGDYFVGTDVEAALQELGAGTILDDFYVNVAGDTMTGDLLINVNSIAGLVVEQSGVNDDVFVVDTTNARIGMGTPTPLGKLHIVGNADDQQLIVQANATQTDNIVEIQDSGGTALSGVTGAGKIWVGNPSANDYIRANAIDAELTATGIYAANFALFMNPAAHSAVVAYGAQMTARIQTGNGYDFSGTFYGVYANVYHQGTGTLTLAQGANIQVLTTTTGVITTGIGVSISAGNVSGGSIGTFYGLKIANSSNATTNYAIYTDVGLNLLGDQLKIVGSADRIQFMVLANAAQSVNIVEFQLSDTTVVSGADERGILFSDGGTDPTNSFFGSNAGNITTSGLYNTAFGANTLSASTSGERNVAVGNNALLSLVDTDFNTAVGYSALQNVLTIENTAVGYSAAFQVTTGTNNTAIGAYTLNGIISGSYNTAVGRAALRLGTGSNNTAVGWGAGATGGAGDNNTYLGMYAFYSNSGGSGNLGIGYAAAFRQTGVSNRLFIDNQLRASIAIEETNALIVGTFSATVTSQLLRLNAAVTIPDSLFVDGSSDEVQLTVQAHSTQTANWVEFQETTGVKAYSGVDSRGLLFSNFGTSNTNFFAGTLAGNATVSGTGNIGIGGQALQLVAAGNHNVAIGLYTLDAVGAGSNNSGFGGYALSSVTAGNSNAAFGYASGILNSIGSNNLYAGAYAGYNHTGGASILLGFAAGYYQTGNNRVVIDSVLRADAASEEIQALIIGTTNATVTSQLLRFNAAVTIPDSLFVDGSSDEIQLKVQGHATQTAVIARLENAATTSYWEITDAGRVNQISRSGVATQDFGSNLSFYKNAPSADAANNVGFAQYAYTQGAQVYSGSLQASTLQAYHSGSNTLALLVGVNAGVGYLSTGVAALARGLQVTSYGSGGGNVTEFQGLYIEVLHAGLTPTTFVGVKIAAQTVASGTLKTGIEIGNISGATTNYALYTNDGQVRFGDDTYWEGDGSGIPYGAMYQTASFTVTLTTQSVWYEADAGTTNIVAGELNLVTFPDDHYLLVTKAGRYRIQWSAAAAVNSVAGGGQHIEWGVMIGGSIQAPGKAHSHFVATARELHASGTCILDLAANAQISLGLQNTSSAGKVVTVEHINLSVTMVGGT